MKLDLIQSASLAVVKTILEEDNFDVKWHNQKNSGYFKAVKVARLNVTDIRSFPSYIVRETSGSYIIEKEFTDRVITIQHTIETRNQQLPSSSWEVAQKLMSSYRLSNIQELCAEAGMAPIFPIPTVYNNDALSDRNRFHSVAAFDLSFNVRSVATLSTNLIGSICAVEYSGSVYDSQQNPTIVGGFVTSSCYPTQSVPVPSAIMYDGLIHFNNEDEQEHIFDITFPESPDVIVLSVFETDDAIPFLQGGEFSSASFTVYTSAPFTGSIRYRALLSTKVPKWPATVTSSFEVSGTIPVSANRMHSVNLTGNPRLGIPISWPGSIDNPEFYITHWNLGRQHLGIPAIVVENLTEVGANGSIGAPFNQNSAGTFHWAAFGTEEE
jgi:hypothetical protein